MRFEFDEPKEPGVDFYEQFQYQRNPPNITVILRGSAEFCDRNYKRIRFALGMLKPTVIQDVAR